MKEPASTRLCCALTIRAEQVTFEFFDRTLLGSFYETGKKLVVFSMGNNLYDSMFGFDTFVCKNKGNCLVCKELFTV